ncbi:hypothetical protein HY312_04370 [Candidatus Saccharibacteria bacterium]|nr:hypothetical protein [Candidatus Saccharibacteria bacterium]
MKKTDIAALIMIASLSVLFAYFVANTVLGSPKPAEVKVKTVEKISSEVVQPDSTVFNKEAINPTVEVIIGDQ